MYGKKRKRSLESRSRTQGSSDWDELIKETYGEDAVLRSKENEVFGSSMKRSQSSPAKLSSPRKPPKNEKKENALLESNSSIKKEPRSQTPLSKRKKAKRGANTAENFFDMMMGTNRRKNEGLVNGDASNLKKNFMIGKSIGHKETLEQVYMDAGQQGLGSTKCSVCGMLYYAGQPTDEKVHKSFHNKFTEGVTFPGWRRETIVHRFACDEQDEEAKWKKTPAGRIIVVDDSISSQQTNKVGEILEMVDRELGGVRQQTEKGNLISRGEKVYIYINEKKRVCACVVVHRIDRAFSIDDYDHHNEIVTSAKASSRKARLEEGLYLAEGELGCEASTQRVLAFEAASSQEQDTELGTEAGEEPAEVKPKFERSSITSEGKTLSTLSILPAPVKTTPKMATPLVQDSSPGAIRKPEQKAESFTDQNIRSLIHNSVSSTLMCTPSTKGTNSNSAVVIKMPKKAIIGVDKIWVHRKFRRSGIATRMLETIRKSFVYGYMVPREEVAFSQPTEMGAGLAIAYTQTSGFLSYK